MRGISALAGVLLAVGTAASTETWKPCVCFETKVQVAPSVVRSGTSPRFVLELANRGWAGVRLLDVRQGRRPDLAVNYYKLVVRRPNGAAVDGPRPISDPGPISETDFFVLEPGARISLPVHSLVSLEGLTPGSYIAYVSIWIDPYSAGSVCRSAEVEFRVQ